MSRLRQPGFGAFGIIMVVATISLMGLVAFRFLDAQDNTEVARKQQQTQHAHPIASVNTASDVDTVVKQIDDVNVDALEGPDLDAELNF